MNLLSSNYIYQIHLINIGLLKFLIIGRKSDICRAMVSSADSTPKCTQGGCWLAYGVTPFHFSRHWKTTGGTELNCLSGAAFMNQHTALLSSRSPSLLYRLLSLLLDTTFSTHSTGV